MKNLYTIFIAVFILFSLNAQVPVKTTWKTALLNNLQRSSALSTDTIQKSITVVQADSMIKANNGNPDFFIIDLRTPDEVKLGHLKNAVNIDFYDSNFNANLDTLDKSKIYLIHCQGGSRSAQAFTIMVKKHFREVYNMLGGYKKWITDGYPYMVDSLTNIHDLTVLTDHLRCYPNPVMNTVTLEYDHITNDATLTLIDLYGRVQIKCNINEQKTVLDVTALHSGIYLLNFVNNGKRETVKLIKQ